MPSLSDEQRTVTDNSPSNPVRTVIHQERPRTDSNTAVSPANSSYGKWPISSDRSDIMNEIGKVSYFLQVKSYLHAQ